MLAETFALALTCLLSPVLGTPCVAESAPQVAGIVQNYPIKTGESLGVVVTAESALVWDVATDKVLFSKQSHEKRPVASLTKLFSAIVIEETIPVDASITITSAAVAQQSRGADVKLPLGHTASRNALLAASLIASANDATVALAEAAAGTETEFVEIVNSTLPELNIHNTKLINATGLQEKDRQQYSTAFDVKKALSRAAENPELGPYLSTPRGVITTDQGKTQRYFTTNELAGTYLPIVAAKTGYTFEAKENVAIITHDQAGHEIGIVVLGSDQRFQDSKILAEWITRNYSWE
jgi:serine-type D-Ala-D-Ala carboxypeptidase (penicillin-binding protein 5/6)